MGQNDQEIKSAKEIAEDKAGHTDGSMDPKKDQPKNAASEPVSTDKQFSADQEGRMKLTFYSYLIMLGAIGWQFLGKIPNPQTGKVEKDMIQVQEIIDLLAILEEKTKGNLSKEEENILKATLSNLRLNYVEEIKK
ncbi:MAG: DUF1844 domain-containing protein [bacterium]|nr:DUF1844 domain-containing protein [bacterium]